MGDAPPSEPQRAVVYLRVSGEAQEDNTSIVTQEADIRRRCQQLGWVVTAVKHDVISGTTMFTERPGLMEALTLMGRGDVLFAWRRDRIARSVGSITALESHLRAYQQRIVTLDAEDADTPEAQLFRTILDAFSAYEREKIRLRTWRGKMHAKFAGQRWGGPAPFGYRYEGGRGRLVVHAEEYERRRRIVELGEAGVGYRDIQKMVPGRDGKKISSHTIQGILRDGVSLKAVVGEGVGTTEWERRQGADD